MGKDNGPWISIEGEFDKVFAVGMGAEVKLFHLGEQGFGGGSTAKGKGLRMRRSEEFPAGSIGIAITDKGNRVAVLADEGACGGPGRGILHHHSTAEKIDGRQLP
jgi:hypothetical protein